MRPLAAILLILCTGCATSRQRIPAGYVRDDCVIAAPEVIATARAAFGAAETITRRVEGIDWQRGDVIVHCVPGVQIIRGIWEDGQGYGARIVAGGRDYTVTVYCDPSLRPSTLRMTHEFIHAIRCGAYGYDEGMRHPPQYDAWSENWAYSRQQQGK